MKKWLYAAGALLIAIGFAILQRPERKLKKVQQQRDDLLQAGSAKAKEKAVKVGAKADKLQAEAVKAAEVGKEAVDNVGKNGESMRDMLDSWRKSDGV